jgi:hypothetical protein
MFKSFYMAGFECATGRNVHRDPFDQIVATRHDVDADADYARLAAIGIHSAREGARWSLIDRGPSFDFDPLAPFIQAARRHELELVWDLFHYGYPEDLDPFDDAFAHRLARYAAAVARHVTRELPGPHYFTPINEPSYFAWAAGEVGRFAPHATGRGHELKVALVRAHIAAVQAIRAACPRAHIVTVDPLCHVVPAPGAAAADVERARQFNRDVVFQFLEMASGRTHPELGGSPECLGTVGLNYYPSNQWELDRGEIPLADSDPRRAPLAGLLKGVARRYGVPVLLSETAASGDARSAWIDELSSVALECCVGGIELAGICLYPVLGMPEWHDRSRWKQMGLWDVSPETGFARTPHVPALRALERAQAALGPERRQKPSS